MNKKKPNVIKLARIRLTKGIKTIPSIIPPVPINIFPVSENGYKKSVNIALKILALNISIFGKGKQKDP
jgi:hypothetical protein